MSQLAQYLITILSAALAISLIGTVMDNKSPVTATIKLICGIFMLLTALSPMLDLRIPNLSVYADELSAKGQEIADLGITASYNQQKAIITEKATAYVLEKAKSLNLDLSAEIKFSNDGIPIPEKIYLFGSAGPFAKEQMTIFIAENLGISEACQIWS